jgi:glucose/mannose transport system substrate-binding protein
MDQAVKMRRRDFLRATGACALAGLATPLATACARRARHPPERPELVLFNRWKASGEADALAHLLSLYQQYFPAVQVVNAAVQGQFASNYNLTLRDRLLSGDPPDTFQVAAGHALVDTWARGRYLEPLTNLWRVEGWRDAFPPILLDQVTFGGEIYAVPANVHRGNLLWYNRRQFEQHGLAPPQSFADLFAVADRLRAQGFAPLAYGSRESADLAYLFETVLLGVGGPDFYQRLFAGRAAWTDATVAEALGIFERLLGYLNPDHRALTWDLAAALLQDGQAAMTIQGDWVKGYFTAHGWVPGADFDAVPAPATQGAYVVICDTFGLPRGVAGRAVTIGFLKLLGSIEGQNALNPLKGSIPARLDAPRGAYDAIAQRNLDDFGRDAIVLSAAHGSAAPELFTEALNETLLRFSERPAVNATTRRLERLAQSLGPPRAN